MPSLRFFRGRKAPAADPPPGPVERGRGQCWLRVRLLTQMPGLQVCVEQWAGKQGSQVRAREGSLLSELNRRQIVWQLWQNERADKFIREKLPVGVFAGHHQPSQKPAPSLAGPHASAPSSPLRTGLAQAALRSARRQLPYLASGTVQSRGTGPHSQGEYRRSEKSHFSPSPPGWAHMASAPPEHRHSLGSDSPPRPTSGHCSQNTGFTGLEHWTGHQVRSGLTGRESQQSPGACLLVLFSP